MSNGPTTHKHTHNQTGTPSSPSRSRRSGAYTGNPVSTSRTSTTLASAAKTYRCRSGCGWYQLSGALDGNLGYSEINKAAMASLVRFKVTRPPVCT